MQYVRICVDKSTRTRLEKYGFKGSSFDIIIRKLLDHADKCDNFWSEIY